MATTTLTHFALSFLFSLITCHVATGAIYYGANYDQVNGVIGSGIETGGKLEISDNGTTVSFKFTKGSGGMSEMFVMYIDSTSGGFNTTSGFSDNSGSAQRAISQLNSSGSSRSTATFIGGFNADYALAFGADKGSGLFQLANGGSGSFGSASSISFSPNNDQNSATYTFSFAWSALGLPNGSGNSFRFETMYVTDTGNSRAGETFESWTSDSHAGFGNSVTFASADFYGLAPVPEPANCALAIFGALFGAGALARRLRPKQAGVFPL